MESSKKNSKGEKRENCECLYKNRCYIKIVLHNIIITSIIIYEFVFDNILKYILRMNESF